MQGVLVSFFTLGGIICVGVAVMPLIVSPGSTKRREVPAAWRVLGDDFLEMKPNGIREGSNQGAETTDQELESPTESVEANRAETTGECRFCGHKPIANGADECPWCGKAEPNPGVVSRYCGKCGLGGLAVGGIGGAFWGLFSIAGGGVPGAIIGLLGGGIAGAVVGLIAGIISGVIAKMNGAR
jgi:hypothetical protein